MRQLEELKLTWEKLHGAGIWEQEWRTQDRTKVINYQNMNQEKNAGQRERERELFKGIKSSCWFSEGIGLAAPPAAGTWEMLPPTCVDGSLLERKPFQMIQGLQEGSTGKAGEKCGKQSDLQGSWPRVNTTMEEPHLPHFPERVQVLPAGKLKLESQNQRMVEIETSSGGHLVQISESQDHVQLAKFTPFFLP